ncbi:MAG: NAD(P)/FAD-dependent oxidoreductase [Fimbriimonadaceae bacterium]
MSKAVVVVGAGISGLVVARRLHQVGMMVTIVDPDTRAGGRIKTDVVNGFRLDRGFQVFFNKYPSVQQELNLDQLHLKSYEPGCQVWDGKKLREVHKENVLDTFFARWLKPQDLIRMQMMGMELARMSDEEIWHSDDVTIEECLKQRGFSNEAIDRFFRPFFGGVFLDRSLQDSARPFLFYMKMLETGAATTPTLGMGEIPEQIAADIPDECFHFGRKVTEIIKTDGYVSGVKLCDGTTVACEAVIVATDGQAAAKLAGIPAPNEFKQATTVHFATNDRISWDPVLFVNGIGRGLVNHVAPVSVVSRDLAPKPQHLVSATILDSPAVDDRYLAESVRYELADWFPNST